MLPPSLSTLWETFMSSDDGENQAPESWDRHGAASGDLGHGEAMGHTDSAQNHEDDASDTCGGDVAGVFFRPQSWQSTSSQDHHPNSSSFPDPARTATDRPDGCNWYAPLPPQVWFWATPRQRQQFPMMTLHPAVTARHSLPLPGNQQGWQPNPPIDANLDTTQRCSVVVPRRPIDLSVPPLPQPDPRSPVLPPWLRPRDRPPAQVFNMTLASIPRVKSPDWESLRCV